uniref:Peptidase C1A papain C-terminal domain-containing protein n=1 Tax=Leersia perrieri TaxID=77586 RepID=A0A0D9VH62_9ORYZ
MLSSTSLLTAQRPTQEDQARFVHALLTMSEAFFPHEFSWKNRAFYGRYILPEIRHQGNKPTCLFNAMCTAAEIEMARTAAMNYQPMYTRFDVDSFVRDYEDFAARIEYGYQCVQIYDVQSIHTFEDVCNTINQGRPVLGMLGLTIDFDHLPPTGIYRYYRERRKIPETTHEVVFIGYGLYFGERYLVFMNSHGERFGDRGFGRVFFSSVSDLMTLRVPSISPFRGP